MAGLEYTHLGVCEPRRISMLPVTCRNTSDWVGKTQGLKTCCNYLTNILNGSEWHTPAQSSFYDCSRRPGPWVRCKIAIHKSFQDVFVGSQGMEADHVCTSCPKWSISANQLSDFQWLDVEKTPTCQLFVVEWTNVIVLIMCITQIMI